MLEIGERVLLIADSGWAKFPSFNDTLYLFRG
jgi:hypothetical protein